MDWGNPLALIQDIVNDIPKVTKLIIDIVTATGQAVPPMLKDIQLTFTMLSGVFSLLKGYSFLVWAVGAALDPGLALLKPLVQKFASQGIAA